MEKYSQNESLNEVISFDDTKFIIVKNDATVHVLTKEQVETLNPAFILTSDIYTPQKYMEILNKNLKK